MSDATVALPFAPLRLGRRAASGDDVGLSDDELVRHLAVFGTTGSGKTALLLAMMTQLMDRSRGFIFCTTKHDPQMPRALAWAAHQRQQLWRLRIFDPAHPVHNYNPIATRNPVTLAKLYHSQLPRIEPGSEAKHYHDLAMEFLLVACKAMLATGLQHVPDDLNQLASNYDLAAPILRQRLRAVGKQDLMANVEAFFRRFFRREEFLLRESREALSGLTAVLTALEHGRGAAFLNQPYSEVELLEACRRGEWVYLGLPRMLDADGGALGRLFLTDLISTLDAIQGDEGTLVHAPFVIVLDEFPSYALPEFAAVFEQARSTGIGLVMGAQTVSGLSDRSSGLSEGFRDRVLGNCGHIVSFRIGPGEGADYLSKYVGKADRGFLQVSHTASRGRSWTPLSPASWFGWTNRTDQHASFSGYRVGKDTITETRVLTHEIASRGEAVWLSTKDEGREPFRFYSLWAKTDTAPSAWNYQALCSTWERQPPEPLGLGAAVRTETLRRFASAPTPGPARPGTAPGARTGHTTAGAPAPAAPSTAPAAPVTTRRRRPLEPGSFVFTAPGGNRRVPLAAPPSPPALVLAPATTAAPSATAQAPPGAGDEIDFTRALPDDVHGDEP